MSLATLLPRCVLSALVLGLASGCAHPPQGSRTMRLEQLVDAGELSKAFQPPIPLELRFDREGAVQSLLAEYRFERRHPREHYMLGVLLAPAGHYLDAASHDARRADPTLTEARRQADFPDIGLRAQSEFFGFGPGGAAYGLTFTTRDGHWDIRLVVGSLLPEEVPSPELDLEALARRIEARYEALAGPRNGRKTDTRQ